MTGLKDILEGKPLRTPLHPAVVHLPIALFFLASVTDVASWVASGGSVTLVRTAFICLVAALVTSLVAGVFGIVDYSDIRKDHPGRKTATTHLLLNLVAVGVFAVGAGLRYTLLTEPRTPLLPLVVSLTALGILSYSGYLGGLLVYDDGIAVGRHRHTTPLPHATIKVRTNGRPAVVADAKDLVEGGTLRVDIDGTVATVIRLQGEVYAFQEFCTHRYGPLSEGTFEGCEVVCPWHRSKFDVRTGKVTGGPAKVDLRTFRAETREGKIWMHPPGPAT